MWLPWKYRGEMKAMTEAGPSRMFINIIIIIIMITLYVYCYCYTIIIISSSSSIITPLLLLSWKYRGETKAMTEAGPQILFVCFMFWLSFMNIVYLILCIIRNMIVVVVEVPGRDEGHDGGGPAPDFYYYYYYYYTICLLLSKLLASL